MDRRQPRPRLGWLQPLQIGIVWNALGAVVFLAAAAVLCGLYLHARVLALAVAVLSVTGLGILWPLCTAFFLRGSLHFAAERGRQGEPVLIRAKVKNCLPWAARGIIVQGGFEVEPQGSSSDATAGFAFVGGWRSESLAWSFVPQRRGVYPLSRPFLATGFPFGLYDARRRLTVDSSLLVWPRTFPVGSLLYAVGNPADGGAVALHRAGSTGDLLGVRPYRQGDSPRRVHWPQSARHDRLVVREVEASARPSVHIVLDDDPGSHVEGGPNGSREWAIRIVASLCEAWLRQGAEVSATLGGRAIGPASGLSHRQVLLDALARLPDDGGPSLAEAMRDAARAARERTLLLVTTDRGLAALQPDRRIGQARLIVLQADAFAALPEASSRRRPPCDLPVRPWRWIDDPLRVPEQVRGENQGAVDGQ